MNSQIRTYDEAFPEISMMQLMFQNRQHRLSRPISRQFSATEAQQRIDKLKQDLQREADMVDQLEASQLDLEREKREQQRRAEVAEARIEALEKQVQSLERGLRLADDQTRGLKLMVSEQDQQMADQGAQIDQQQAIERHKNLSRIRERDRTHLEDEELPITDLDTAKDLVTHLTRSVEEKESQLKDVEAVIDELTESRDGFEFDNGQLQAKVQRIEQELKESYDNFNEYHAECEHEFELAEEAKADQAEVIRMLDDEKAVLQARIEEVPQVLQKIEDEISENFDDFSAYWENELRLVEQTMSDQAEAIDMLARDKLALQAQLRDLESQNNDLTSTNDRLDADWREELELLEEQKDQQDVISGLMDDKAVLIEQVREAQASEKIAWELVHKKAALRRQENKDWLAEAERADEYSAGLKEEINKGQEEAAKLTEKIEKLRSEKLDVYDAWREEVKYLDEKIKEGEDANIVLKDQISILEEEVQEMTAQRMVSDVDDQDKNASESGSTSTFRGSSPAMEAPGSPIYDVPGWNPPIDDSANNQPQAESGVFVDDDDHAANEHLWDHEPDNNNSSDNWNNDSTENIKERRPSWGGPWEQTMGKRG
ncbi:hypothetical protein NA56DRAFT_663420 [Hyaloscypha hepaticicola]|uniref:Uncharacterized protein n=1 Tax=Hyaloscypha hepaticicola TaxID=2082293 RepID=A0A2J6PPF7_9HELO|nr:hypothetical protein NA56DRAFT_663420 [Hyaloscypha hepaticicola]